MALPGLSAATKPIRRRSVAGQILILQLVVLALCSIATTAALIQITQHAAKDRAAQQALAVAETFAAAPETVAGLSSADPTAILQPVAEAIRRRTGVDFLVVMSTSGIRYSHPNPALINHRFVGHIEPATRGRAFTETYTGTLGPSIRAVVPAVTPDGSIVGLVAVGITIKAMEGARRHQIVAVLLAGIAIVSPCLIFVVALSNRVRRQTHGLHPDDIARLFHFMNF